MIICGIELRNLKVIILMKRMKMMKKTLNYNELNEAERFFVDCLNERCNHSSTYNMIPTTVCFSYCINEIVKIFHLYNESNKRINHFELCDDFYEFLLNDSIFKQIDEAQYYLMLRLVKSLSGGAANYAESENFFVACKGIFVSKYFDTLYNNLISLLKNNNIDDVEYLENIINTFINEILSQKCTYMYFCSIVLDLLNKDLFENIYDFIEYISEKKCRYPDNIEMYLPLKNVEHREFAFIKTKQDVVSIDETYYCKIYASKTIDYYRMCELNMRRIKSIFNIYRFNRDTRIDFDYSKEVIVKRATLNDEFKVGFRDLITYKYFVGKQNIIEQTIKSLDIVSKHDSVLYYTYNNILDYAEKDNDFLTVSSYVDNWIALESIIKLSGSRVGFEGVMFFVPKLLSIKYLRQEINFSLKNAFHDKSVTLEKFVDICIKNKELACLEKCQSLYYKHKLEKYIAMLGNYTNIREYIKSIEKRLEFDIQRIYLVRNEYVHSSNLAAYNNLQKIKLKRILADVIDAFTKSLNGNINVERYTVSGKDIFSDILRKYMSHDTALEIMSGKYKTDNQKVGKKSLVSALDEYEILKNIIFERMIVFNHSKRFDDEDNN